MFSGLIAFGHSIWNFVTPESLFYVFGSTLIGLVIGALPGLTATMGLALMTTLTLKMPSSQALLVLICTYVGAIYGGSRSAILLNIPGTPASAAHPLPDPETLRSQHPTGQPSGSMPTLAAAPPTRSRSARSVVSPWGQKHAEGSPRRLQSERSA